MRISTVLTVLPLALAKPIRDSKRAELAPLILHENANRAELAPLILHEDGEDKLATRAEPAPRSEPAPLYLHEDAKAIHARGGSNKFIIKFKPDTDDAEIDKALKDINDESLTHRYKNKFQGFTADVDRETVEKFRMNPIVEYIEQDVAGKGSAAFYTQERSTWGLSRISHLEPGEDNYRFDGAAGQGVCVYVTDTGIDENHPQFGGRAHQIKSFINGVNTDDHGHGTHCAGTIGSASYGVAKKATLYGVKVISREDRFEYSDLIAAYDFIQRDARERQSKGECPKGVIVSGSLGGTLSPAMNDAANNLAEAGILMVVAAGNDNQDTRNFSPASASKVCTVGGSNRDDTRYDMSNHGPKVNINAPAVNVLSLAPGGGTAYMTGTSMAAPHVAGMAAVLASEGTDKASPALCQAMVNLSNKSAGIQNQVSGTTTNIAYNGKQWPVSK